MRRLKNVALAVFWTPSKAAVALAVIGIETLIAAPATPPRPFAVIVVGILAALDAAAWAVRRARQNRDAIAAHKAAKADLRAEYDQILATDPERNETDGFGALNARVVETAGNVPWYRR